MIRLFVLLLVYVGMASSSAAAQDFFGTLVDRAQASAAQPYRKEAPIPETVSLGYDAYRGIRFRPESMLWREGGSDFRVEFFPTGFLYQTPVKLNVIARTDRSVTALTPSPSMFDFGAGRTPASVGFAGFKLTYPLHGQRFDEIVSFLGASYFRPIGATGAWNGIPRWSGMSVRYSWASSPCW